jgi:hypothetical protein
MRNRTSPTKRRRRRDDIEAIRCAIEDLLEHEWPMTVRQVFYRLVSLGVIAKTETEYKSTVCRLLAEMRREGRIAYSAIADNTRWMRKPRTYANLAAALDQMQAYYRRSVWGNQSDYVEIWLEKDALAGVLYEVTERWDVPLMVTRGFPSLSFLHTAAEQIHAHGKYARLYYFGDHDPSGVLIEPKIEETLATMLCEMGSDVVVYVERVAVLPEQIEAWNLPTRPTKRKGTHAKAFEGDSVEVDAIPPDDLRGLCERCITRHIDSDALVAMRQTEMAERETLAQMLERGLR